MLPITDAATNKANELNPAYVCCNAMTGSIKFFQTFDF